MSDPPFRLSRTMNPLWQVSVQDCATDPPAIPQPRPT